MMLSHRSLMFNPPQLVLVPNTANAWSYAEMTYDVVPAIMEFLVLLVEAILLSPRPVFYYALMAFHQRGGSIYRYERV